MPTVAELVKRMREEFLDDPVAEDESDNKWRTPMLVSGLNASQDEITRRLLCITDATTASVGGIPLCSVPLLQPVDGNGDPIVGSDYLQSQVVSRKVLKVNQLFYPGITLPLKQRSRLYFDQFDPGWIGKSGTPIEFCTDYETGKITFNRVPEAAGTVTMNVCRLPIARLSPTSAGLQAAPELQEMDDQLIFGALRWSYILDDNHVQDKAAAKRWSDAFEASLSLLTINKAHLSPQAWVTRGTT